MSFGGLKCVSLSSAVKCSPHDTVAYIIIVHGPDTIWMDLMKKFFGRFLCTRCHWLTIICRCSFPKLNAFLVWHNLMQRPTPFLLIHSCRVSVCDAVKYACGIFLFLFKCWKQSRTTTTTTYRRISHHLLFVSHFFLLPFFILFLQREDAEAEGRDKNKMSFVCLFMLVARIYFECFINNNNNKRGSRVSRARSSSE